MIFLVWFRRVLAGLLPGAAAVAAVFVASEHLAPSEHAPSWLSSLPLILLSVAALLGILFRQARMALVTVLLVAVARQCTPESPTASTATLRAALLLPVWFGACGSLREQRLFTSKGLLFLALSAAAGALLFLPSHPYVDDRIAALMQCVASTTLAAHSSLPVAALVLVLATAGILMIGRRALTGGLLMQSLALSMLALDAQGPHFGHQAEVFFCCAMSGSAAVLLCAILAGAWQNAFIDELTGLPGRRAMSQHIASLGRRNALAMVDVDHFKKINDRHGHDVGDQVLRFLAARLHAFRHGTAYRYGGEEFVLVLKRGEPKRQMAQLDALREDIASKRFVVRSLDRPNKKPRRTIEKTPSRGSTIKVTVSIGMARRSDKHRKPDEILQAADKALYRAKRAGRNQVRK